MAHHFPNHAPGNLNPQAPLVRLILSGGADEDPNSYGPFRARSRSGARHSEHHGLMTRTTVKAEIFLLTVVALGHLLTAAPQAAVKRLDGSTISPGEIDGTVLRLMRAAEVTGVGISILNHGKVAYQKAYGFRDAEKKLPLTADSVMDGASFTKVAFSYLVMKLVEERTLDLDNEGKATRLVIHTGGRSIPVSRLH
jgi:CubicO group peptidase (beta-lactamase class C family)